MSQLFGWVPPSWRTRAQRAIDDEIRQRGIIRPFAYSGRVEADVEKVALWEIARKIRRDYLPNWQVTGSCVGAAWGTVAEVRMAVDIYTGDLERWSKIFWPWTWGQSRTRGGLYGPGEGSFGSAMAEAAVKDGFITVEEAASKVPAFGQRDGWPILTESVERQFSDGRAMAKEPYVGLAKIHPFKAVVEIRSVEEAEAAIVGAKQPITVASMFGFRTCRPQGNPPVNIAEWDDRWPHQMLVWCCWRHPQLGRIWGWSNNWGPQAHPQPVDGSLPGGFYTTDSLFAKILRASDTEAYAFGDLEGLREKTLSWANI